VLLYVYTHMHFTKTFYGIVSSCGCAVTLLIFSYVFKCKAFLKGTSTVGELQAEGQSQSYTFPVQHRLKIRGFQRVETWAWSTTIQKAIVLRYHFWLA